MTVGLIILGIGAVLFFLFGRKSGGKSDIRSISAAEAKEMLSQRAAVALDVRTPMEVKAGKIAGAKELNVTSMNFKEGLSALDKSKTYVVYCRSGKRSLKACQIMASSGFEDIYNMEGGFLAYK